MKWFAALVCCAIAFAQGQSDKKPDDKAAKEQQELSQSLADAGTSSVDFIAALENHLDKYPDTKQRATIEKALVKAAIEAKDNRRIVLYGERVLKTGNPDDLEIIDHVVRALLAGDDQAQARRALPLAQRYAGALAKLRQEPAPSRYSAAQWAEELDRGAARALALEARAAGNAGNPADALAYAKKSWETYPTGEGARETGRWLAKLGRNIEAVQFYADAFTLEDPRSTEIDRAKDRAHMGELYAKANGSEKGLGDLVLQAYDRTSALMNSRLAVLKAADPNVSAAKITDFTLPALDGQPLVMSSLKGKTVVMDFWATWCGPCRVQHPMIEKVQQKFQDDPNVVFLSVDTDEDHSLVAPFLKEHGWKSRVYFEAGLSRLLTISSIPTVIVLNPAGEISSRMAGFLPDRFTDMLTERIVNAKK